MQARNTASRREISSISKRILKCTVKEYLVSMLLFVFRSSCLKANNIKLPLKWFYESGFVEYFTRSLFIFISVLSTYLLTQTFRYSLHSDLELRDQNVTVYLIKS